MRDFFARQEDARRQTRNLLLLFTLAVWLIILALYAVIRGLILWDAQSEGIPLPFWDMGQFLLVAAGTSLVILAGSVYRIRDLRQGGFRVAEMLGGRRIPQNTEAPGERQLLNVVEEMAIASGTPVPDVYLLPQERGINAFAAGFGAEDSVICVTRGALHHLNRDELQGVIAHEFSHILNSDTLINLRLMGWLNGLLLLSLLGRGVLHGLGRGRSRRGGAFIVVGFALYILGYLGVLLGHLIKSAISRQREYLADASAVQFTRNPEGLSGALKKVGGLIGAGRLLHPQTLEASHMLFCSGLKESWSSLLSTHPPLHERILRLDSRFDGVFPTVESISPAASIPAPPPRKISPSRRKGGPALSGAAAAAILDTVGTPMQDHAERARSLLASFPEAVRSAAREPSGACALIYLLLLDRREEVRTRQLETLREKEPPAVTESIDKLSAMLGRITPELRLPLMDLAFPALRQLSRPQFERFWLQVKLLSEADGKESLFELALGQALQRHLANQFDPSPQKVSQIYGIRGASWECSCILTLLSRIGHRREEDAQEAFNRGERVLREPGFGLEFLPLKDCAPNYLKQALENLCAASPLIKRKLLAACLETLINDGVITTGEGELFRAIADALGCPVPPWLIHQNSTQDKRAPAHPPAE